MIFQQTVEQKETKGAWTAEWPSRWKVREREEGGGKREKDWSMSWWRADGVETAHKGNKVSWCVQLTRSVCGLEAWWADLRLRCTRNALLTSLGRFTMVSPALCDFIVLYACRLRADSCKCFSFWCACFHARRFPRKLQLSFRQQAI